MNKSILFSYKILLPEALKELAFKKRWLKFFNVEFYVGIKEGIYLSQKSYIKKKRSSTHISSYRIRLDFSSNKSISFRLKCCPRSILIKSMRFSTKLKISQTQKPSWKSRTKTFKNWTSTFSWEMIIWNIKKLLLRSLTLSWEEPTLMRLRSQ